MLLCAFLAFLALASGAPQHFHSHFRHHHGPPRPRFDSSELFSGPMFDPTPFWEEMNREMQRLDELLSEFRIKFPVVQSSESGIKGDKFIVTINMNGFEEKDIKVKAREGILMVQAVHKFEDGSERSYIDVKTLPSYVNVNGTWTYEMNVLKVVFGLNSRPEDSDKVDTEGVDKEFVTQAPEDRSREEMDPEQSTQENQEAEVGVGDNTDNEISSNLIPRDNVEATTYAVDLKNEVEFVPIKY